jgi:hypothetical protein
MLTAQHRLANCNHVHKVSANKNLKPYVEIGKKILIFVHLIICHEYGKEIYAHMLYPRANQDIRIVCKKERIG